MTGLYIAVAVLFALFLGVLLCVVGFAFWYLLKILNSFKGSVDKLAIVAGEVMTEGSFSRISKSLFILSNNLPEMMEGFKEFSRVMRIFNNNAFDKDKVAAAEPEAGAVYTATEADQAQQEIVDEARRNKINISDEQLATMRTEGRK